MFWFWILNPHFPYSCDSCEILKRVDYYRIWAAAEQHRSGIPMSQCISAAISRWERSSDRRCGRSSPPPLFYHHDACCPVSAAINSWWPCLSCRCISGMEQHPKCFILHLLSATTEIIIIIIIRLRRPAARDQLQCVATDRNRSGRISVISHQYDNVHTLQGSTQ